MIDKAIFRAERHIYDREKWGAWSHAFIFQGKRLDGHDWVIESDLEVARKHIRLGVQENRVDKYYDESLYSSLAILDFGLSEEKVFEIISKGLELIANRSKYSVRELLGTLFALRHPGLREKRNLLSRDSSFFCSAFVTHLFTESGIQLSKGVAVKNTTPEDLFLTQIPHQKHILQRASLKSTGIRQKIRTKVRSLRKNPT